MGKYYVYRFLDECGKILYVGQTTNLEGRMYQHFIEKEKGEQLYEFTKKVEILELASQVDMSFIERYFIQKYQPVWNVNMKESEPLSCFLVMDEKWQEYDHTRSGFDEMNTLQLTFGWIKENIDNFNNKNSGEHYGTIDRQNEIIYIVRSIFNEFLDGYGISDRLILADWASKNAIVTYQEPKTGKIRYNMRKTINGDRNDCVALKIEASKNYAKQTNK